MAADVAHETEGFIWEQEVCPELQITDIRPDLLQRTRTMAVARCPSHPWDGMCDEELLRDAGLYRSDNERGCEGFMRAAVLLLGTDDAIAQTLPSCQIEADARLQDGGSFCADEHTVVKTNLMETYDQLLAFLQRHLPDTFHLEGTASVSVRDIIARELVVNLLIHRDYASIYPAKLLIDRSGIHTVNACRFMNAGKLTPENAAPHLSNPCIARFFANIGLAEVSGNGIRKLFRYSLAYSGKLPTLYEDHTFQTQVPMPAFHGERVAQRNIDVAISMLLREYGFLTVPVLSSVASISEAEAREHIARMVSAGILSRKGSGDGCRYASAR